MKDLPIYDITIEDDAEIQGVSKISLVDVPAIGVNWIALRKVELKLQDVFGYETQHFDICPGAQATFKNYSEMQLDEDTIGMIRSAAQNADNVFEIEKRVIEAGKATREDLEQVKILVADFKDIISEIDKITGQPQNVDYMDGHIKVVEDLMPKTMMAVRMRKSKMIFAKRECLACPPNGDGTRVNGEPDKRCKGDGAEKTPKGGGGKASAKPAGKNIKENIKDKIGNMDRNYAGYGTTFSPDESKMITDALNKLNEAEYKETKSNSGRDKTISKPYATTQTTEYRTDNTGEIVRESTLTKNYSRSSYDGVPPSRYGDTGRYFDGDDIGSVKTYPDGRKEYRFYRPAEAEEFFKRLNLRKQTFAKKECFGCPPNGDGTRVNGEPDRRCKGDGSGKTAKGGGGKGSIKKPKVDSKQPEKSLPNVKDFPSSVVNGVVDRDGLAKSVMTYTDEQLEFWSDQKNIDAVKSKSDELQQTQKTLSERVKSYNEKLDKYPTTYSWQYGGFIKNIPPEERDAIAAEARGIKLDKATYEKDVELQNKLNSVVREIETNGGPDGVASLKETVAGKRAEEAEKIRKRETEKRDAERLNKQRIKEEKEVAKLGTVARAGNYQDGSDPVEKAGLEAYKAWENASQQDRRNMVGLGAPGGSFKTAYIREDTESEQRFVPNKPILNLNGDGQKKYDNLTLESKKSLISGIKDVPRMGMEGQHIIDVEYKDGTKSTVRVVTGSTRVTTGPGRDKWGLPTDYVDVQFSWIYDWNY